MDIEIAILESVDPASNPDSGLDMEAGWHSSWLVGRVDDGMPCTWDWG